MQLYGDRNWKVHQQFVQAYLDGAKRVAHYCIANIPEDVIITITNRGYIKRLSVDTYKVQKRGGKGITGTKMQEDDFVEKMMYTSSHDNIMFFTNYGKVFRIKGYELS